MIPWAGRQVARSAVLATDATPGAGRRCRRPTCRPPARPEPVPPIRNRRPSNRRPSTGRPPSRRSGPGGLVWSRSRSQNSPATDGQQGAQSSRLRPTARRGPCADAPAEWRDRRESASAAGSRGSWPGGGCSVGRSACSRSRSITIRRQPHRARGRLGWTTTLPTAVSLVEQHRLQPRKISTACEDSTVRIDPGQGQTGVTARPVAHLAA